MNQVLIYSLRRSARLSYVLDVCLRERLGLSYLVVNDAASFSSSNLPKINYSQTPLSAAELHLPATNFLFARSNPPQTLSLLEYEGRPAFFPASSTVGDYPFDLFAVLFFLLSRYEEYLPFRPDQHGRFPVQASTAFQNGFLQRPLVDEWVHHLGERLQQRFPALRLHKPIFQVKVTIDIDQAWAYRHQPWWRQWAVVAKNRLSGQQALLAERRAVLAGLAPDPFDQFEWLESLHRSLDIRAYYFFLAGTYGRYDKNISPLHPAMTALLQQLGASNTIGWHPSYGSHRSLHRLGREKQKLEHALGKEITDSRQHYLKFSLPTTYRRLISLGIRDDYSMGYASAIGFRAGTAQSFPWYDLEREEATSLRLHPFQIMDVTLRQYLGYSPEEAWIHSRQLLEATHAVGGCFCMLWHNSSLTDQREWAGWKVLYEKLLRAAMALQ